MVVEHSIRDLLRGHVDAGHSCKVSNYQHNPNNGTARLTLHYHVSREDWAGILEQLKRLGEQTGIRLHQPHYHPRETFPHGEVTLHASREEDGENYEKRLEAIREGYFEMSDL